MHLLYINIDISIADSAVYPNLPASRDLTDYYLLALAIHHQARLATLDQRIDPGLLPNGPQAFHWIGQ